MQHLPWVDDSQDERDIAAELEDGSEQEHDAKKDHDLSTGTPDNDREKEIEDSPKDISSRPRPDFVDVVFGFDHVDDKMNTLPTDMGLGEPSMNIFLRPQFHIPNVEVHEAIESLELVEIPPRKLPLVILVDGERHSSEGEEVVEEWTPAEESLPKKKKAAKCTKPTKPNSSTSGQTQQNGEATYRGLFEQIKNTNMPKKLLKMFKTALKLKLRNLKEEVKLSKRNGSSSAASNELTKILTSTMNRLDRRNTENVGTKDLANFFCGDESSKIENRRLMKLCLSQLVFEEVLKNDNIPADNKFSYLKCLKTVEWRMRVSDDSLVTRVQSKY